MRRSKKRRRRPACKLTLAPHQRAKVKRKDGTSLQGVPQERRQDQEEKEVTLGQDTKAKMETDRGQKEKNGTILLGVPQERRQDQEEEEVTIGQEAKQKVEAARGQEAEVKKEEAITQKPNLGVYGLLHRKQRQPKEEEEEEKEDGARKGLGKTQKAKTGKLHITGGREKALMERSIGRRKKPRGEKKKAGLGRLGIKIQKTSGRPRSLQSLCGRKRRMYFHHKSLRLLQSMSKGKLPSRHLHCHLHQSPLQRLMQQALLPC